MESKYILTAEIGDWIVNKSDLEKIWLLFKKRFSNSIEIKTVMKTGNGELTKKFLDFKSFDNYIQKNIIGLEKGLQQIEILGNQSLLNFVRWARLEVDFRFSETRFIINGEGNDKTKDWADGFLGEFKTLVTLFSFKSEDKFIQLFREKNLEKYKYKKFVVAMDYLGGSKTDAGNKEFTLLANKWWEKSSVQAIFLVGAIAGIVSLIIAVIMSLGGSQNLKVFYTIGFLLLFVGLVGFIYGRISVSRHIDRPL
ncbi:MAG: hypothetical protein WC499_03220 [Patescibacteria group bacterium]